jgi:hypothetical protein
MSFLQLNENEGSSMYIQFVFKDGVWKSNDEIIEAKYFMIHPDFKTGFSKYENGVYKNMWDEKVGVRPDNYKELLADGYARSFWCRVLIKDKGVFAWSDKVDGKAPVFEYIGNESVVVRNGKGFQAKLKYLEWKDIPEDFDEQLGDDSSDDEESEGIPF